MNDLAFYNAENELIFERKRTPIGPQKWQNTVFVCLRIQDRDASGESLPLELVLAWEDDGQANLRAAASRWLAGVRDSVALKKLLRRASDESPEVRANAAASLGAIGDVEAVGPLIQALEDGDRGVRNRAAGSLKQLGTPGALTAVRAWTLKRRRS